MSNLVFKIKGVNENPTKLHVEARQFKFIVDEPPELGGTDEGPNPVEYLIASLAGCLNVVAHVVAKELGINVKKLVIAVEGSLNPAKFLGETTEERPGYNNITVSIDAQSDADEETTKKWLKIVESRCPVSDNIANATPVAITLTSNQ